MDKYTRRISEGNLFRDELYIIPKKNDSALQGTYDFKLLMIFNKNELTDENKTFLNSILKQIPNSETVSLSNIGILELNDTQCSILELVNAYNPKYVFTWGCEKLISGCPSDLLSPIHLGSLGLIHCPKLQEVESNKAHKSELWQGMKDLFNIQ